MRDIDRSRPSERLFLDRAPDLVATIRETARSMDLDPLMRSAHDLRLLAIGVGATQLVELSRGLERHTAYQDPAALAENVRRVEQVFDRVRSVLGDVGPRREARASVGVSVA